MEKLQDNKGLYVVRAKSRHGNHYLYAMSVRHSAPSVSEEFSEALTFDLRTAQQIAVKLGTFGPFSINSYEPVRYERAVMDEAKS